MWSIWIQQKHTLVDIQTHYTQVDVIHTCVVRRWRVVSGQVVTEFKFWRRFSKLLSVQHFIKRVLASQYRWNVQSQQCLYLAKCFVLKLFKVLLLWWEKAVSCVFATLSVTVTLPMELIATALEIREAGTSWAAFQVFCAGHSGRTRYPSCWWMIWW